MKLSPQTTLLVMALEMEARGKIEALGFPIIFTGVGKVNAAHALTKHLALCEHTGHLPKLVLNIGTAGSRKFKAGSLVACHRFEQRDMDVTPLGMKKYETPFDDRPITIEHSKIFTDMPHGLCATGDNFATEDKDPNHEVIEMEAYALAKVCTKENVPFAAVKFITDGIDGQAATDWPAMLEKASIALSDFVTSKL